MPNQSAASRVQADLQTLFKSNLAPGYPYIKFQLASDIIASLAMDQVQESMIVEAEQITTLPGMPESAIGIMSSRDRVFFVFDLAQLLALPTTLINTRQYQVIVLQVGISAIFVGFAVSQLQGIVRLSTEQIQPPSTGIFANFDYCISGTFQQDESIISILELNLVLNALNKLS